MSLSDDWRAFDCRSPMPMHIFMRGALVRQSRQPHSRGRGRSQPRWWAPLSDFLPTTAYGLVIVFAVILLLRAR
jgi:hypothetical protein